VLPGDALEHGAQRAAWAAPRRPEVHDDRNAPAPLDDVALEVGVAGVADEGVLSGGLH
jgi:hypothetical protein